MTPLELALKNFPKNYQFGDVVGGISAAANGFMQGVFPQQKQNQTQLTFGANPLQPNWYGAGMVGAYLGSQALLNKKNDRNYEAYRNRWIRDYQVPSLIHDPNKFGDQYTSAVYQTGGTLDPQQFRDAYMQYGDSLDNHIHPDYLKTGPNSHMKISPEDKAKLESRYNSRTSNNFFASFINSLSAAVQSPQDFIYGLKTAGSPHYIQQKQTGGMTQEQMGQFNRFNDYVRKAGYAESDKLNNQSFSKNLYSKFQASNPDVKLGYDQMIPMAQREQYTLQQTAQGFAGQHGDPNASTIMNNITPLDNMYGPKTSTYNFPLLKTVDKRNERVVASSNQGVISNFNGQDDYVVDPYSGDLVKKKMEKGGWIAGAVNPAHKGYCTPMTKSTCTPRRKAFARRAKAGFKQEGGATLTNAQDQAQGYYAHPNAAYLKFPGKGQRTFVPGPFPLAVVDDGGVQMLDKYPIRTMGNVTEIPIFKEGGEVKTATKVKRKDATIEAEKGELIFGAGAPGSYEDSEDRIGAGLYRVGGKKHSDGGTPLKAFPGDFVFSNDTKLAFNKEDSELLTGAKPTSKRLRTPAKLANKYMDLNKFINMAQDPEIDPISKKTAILNVNNFIDRLGEIAYGQEEKKGFPTGIPAFAQASLQSRGYDQQGLQSQLSGGYRLGGEVPKYQTGGINDSIYDTAKPVTEIPKGFSYYGKRDLRNFYIGPDGKPRALTPSDHDRQYQGNKYIQDVLLKSPKNLTQYSWQQLSKQGYGAPNSPLGKIWDDQYYKPTQGSSYVYTHDQAPVTGLEVNSGTPFMDVNVKARGMNQDFASYPSPEQPEDPQLTNYMQNPNQNFDVNAAELYGIYAANKQYKSRYPTAYRNYEIGNAKALVSSNYSPISEQPYLNAINRSTLGMNQNQTPTGNARNQGAFNSALGAQNQAISQVYAQNQGRKDQQTAALAQLEIQDGQDRIMNQEKYDNKLETLGQNKENEAKYRTAQNAALINQMTRDRESKGLFNVMSDYYEIGQNNQIRMKPTYKLENGKITQVQRNVADLIKSAGQTQNSQYMNTLENVFKMMQRYGITSGTGFIDDVLKQSLIPPRP